MAITLNISNSQLDKEGLDRLTQELCQVIEDETDIAPKLGASAGKQGTKAAEIITIGAIVLTFLESGAAVALFGIFKSYFDRQPSLELSFKDGKGLDVTVNAKNIDSADIQQLIAQLQSGSD